MNDQKYWKDLEDELNLAVPLVDPPSSLEGRIMAGLPSKKRSGSVYFRPWMAWAAAALLLSAGNLGQWIGSQSSALRPGLQVVMLTGVGEGVKAYGTIVLDPDDNHGILAVRDLPLPSTGKQYQLWLDKDRDIRGAGVFTVNDDGYGAMMLTLPADMKGFHDFFITLEVQGGSALPSRNPVMAGKF